ncbi:MAG: hydrogenase nickel incorporation protein HypB [bacterium]
MCKDCGCGDANMAHSHDGQVHAHPHPHGHDHSRGHTHGHPAAAAAETRTVTLQQKILSRNDEQAERNRAWLKGHGVVAVNLISSPGSGKTYLLERTLEGLRGKVSCAVITGDQRTDNDARRLQGKGAPVRQIETLNSCHLDAEQVGRLLPEVVGDGVKLLFIENVGNLVCPAAFDLGESFKIALLSTTEGEDKPVKYPTLFSLAPVAVLTKMDLVPHLDWDAAACRDALRQVRPGVFIFEVSAKTGLGMEAWLDYLVTLV